MSDTKKYQAHSGIAKRLQGATTSLQHADNVLQSDLRESNIMQYCFFSCYTSRLHQI